MRAGSAVDANAGVSPEIKGELLMHATRQAHAVLGALLVVRLACPVPQHKKKKKSKSSSPVKKSRPAKAGSGDLQI